MDGFCWGFFVRTGILGVFHKAVLIGLVNWCVKISLLFSCMGHAVELGLSVSMIFYSLVFGSIIINLSS